MSILSRLFPSKVENKLSTKPDNKSVANAILIQQKFRMREDLRTFEAAIDNRDNIVNYNREDIHRIYREVLQDAHVRSQWNNRKLKTLKKQFFVMPVDGEEPNKELTELLKAPWFYKFMDVVLDSRAWGFTLLEFGLWNAEKMSFESYRMKESKKIHEDIEVVERDNVKPEYGTIGNTPGQIDGLDFTKEKYSSSLVFVGESENGWLYDAAKPYLIKNNTLQNWSEFAELFGMDTRFFQTDAQGDDLTDARASLKQSVGGGTFIGGQDDKLSYIGTGRSDAYQVFKQLVDQEDSTISKLILGQDVISNNTGQVIGEVGERVSNLYGDADAKLLKFIIEDKLFPLMEKHGVSFEGHTFEWDTKESLTLAERADIDLKISQMGFTHSDDYINENYDTNVETSESANLTETQNKLKEVYNEYSNNTKRNAKYISS